MLEIGMFIKWNVERIIAIKFIILSVYRKIACRRVDKSCILKGTRTYHPQNVPLWHINYFEQKAREKQQIYEGLFGLPFIPKKQGTKFLMTQVPSLHQEEKNILITGDTDSTPRWICTNKPKKITHISFIFPGYFLTVYYL